MTGSFNQLLAGHPPATGEHSSGSKPKRNRAELRLGEELAKLLVSLDRALRLAAERWGDQRGRA
ncbi:MAG: hypothetical protein KIS67_02930 [Verrucomicrobiae bacterium]|nr:hypothetical protein [Verrucomicrobiae bacterium]